MYYLMTFVWLNFVLLHNKSQKHSVLRSCKIDPRYESILFFFFFSKIERLRIRPPSWSFLSGSVMVSNNRLKSRNTDILSTESRKSTLTKVENHRWESRNVTPLESLEGKILVELFWEKGIFWGHYSSPGNPVRGKEFLLTRCPMLD